MRRTLCALFATIGLTAAAFVGLAQPASALVPPVPSGEHVTAATSTSFTVTMNRVSPATAYRLLIAHTTTDLQVVHINHTTLHATSSTPSVTIGGLPYSTAPWYYRTQIFNGTAYKWGTVILAAGLQPPTPTGLHAVTGSIGTYLAWTPVKVGTGFNITQATNSSMTQNRVVHTMLGNNYLYTPYLLSKGTTYYFQVQAMNQTTYSHHSSVVAVNPQSAQTSLRVMTYNILTKDSDNKAAGGTTIAPWSSRRVGVAKLINQAAPDVMGIQEASTFMTKTATGAFGVRQIDDLMKLLPNYALARTEIPPSVHGYMRTGVYIIYKKSTWMTVGAGGHWDIGGRFAAYQLMRSRATGATFLFTTTHLTADGGTSYDSMRETETKNLIKDAGTIAGPAHVRVVFSGDWNSDPNVYHTFDGPSLAMHAGPVFSTDARDAAIYHYNAQYNSCNGYQRTPVAAGDDIDSIYVGPGIAVRSWGVLIDLVNGQFSGTIPSDHNPIWSTITVGGP